MEGMVSWPWDNAGDDERAKAWVFIPAVQLTLSYPSYLRMPLTYIRTPYLEVCSGILLRELGT